MRDDLERISEALDVPLRWLLWIASLGVVLLVAAVGPRNKPLGALAAGWGLLISLTGARAAVRPIGPFKLETWWSNLT